MDPEPESLSRTVLQNSSCTSPSVPNTTTVVLAENEKLHYEIYRYSSFSTNYFPENILVDCPGDQSSRWSAITNNPPQYLTLKLKRPAIAKQIKFGKFEKSHVCNIKKFRIYGGLTPESMVLLLEGGLKNDNIPEVFNLRCRTEDNTEDLPVLYLKIMPMLSWGPTFNFSIWYVEVHGQDDPMYTTPCMKSYNKMREVQIVKLCLKHFRQQGYNDAFTSLQQQTKVQLEHPLISELHSCLVVNGEFDKAEEFLAQCVSAGLMDVHLSQQDYKHMWSMQPTKSSVRPGNRGGHQLVMDSKKRLVYLYGGWDGFQDLSDLWVFDIETAGWSQLFENSEKYNGPTPRSCHKMVFDPVSEYIFIFGRYLENSIRTTEYIKSDFYLYDTRAQTWMSVCDDTSRLGGPQLVYDHQMCIDVVKRTIYIFGGKILTPRSVSTSSTSCEPEYSGLFAYHIDTNAWTHILVDIHHPSASNPDVHSIKSRITHCMVFHNRNRKLYIYGGQRGKEDIYDMFTYDVDLHYLDVIKKKSPPAVTVIGNAVVNLPDSKNEPSPCYALRATIDCDRDEIYVFSSLSKLKDRHDIQQIDPSNSFWVYSLQTNKWGRIYSCCPNTDIDLLAENNGGAVLEPCPRFAHQLIYDDVAKIHYLFGGNPGKTVLPQLRLDDFWTLSLEKPNREEILNHCRFLVRKLRYEEMTRTNPYKAMHYLREQISKVIDHKNPEQLNNFHKLAGLLFKADDAIEQSPSLTPSLAGYESNEKLEVAEPMICGGIANLEDENKSSLQDKFSEITSEMSFENSNGAFATDAAAQKVSDTQQVRQEYLCERKARRSFLFNKIVQLMPADIVQPDSNISDFVVM